jgi:hypothetical protein
MVIATRVLTLRHSGADIPIAIRVFAPERDGDAWTCRYEIDWPEGTRTTAAGGADSVQALTVALKMIGADLYSSLYHKSGKLRLTAPGKGYGFPVPSSIRDMLEGDDEKYF